MNKKFTQVSIVVLFLLNACSQVNARETPLATSTLVKTVDIPTLLQTPTNTTTSIPTETPTASITPLPTIPTFTPTFDVSTIVSVTPASKAKCPKEDPTVSAQIFPYEGDLNNTEIAEKILVLLNEGMPKSKIIREVADSPTLWGVELIEEKDLTYDGVLELIIQIGNGFAIYKCNLGKYEISLAMVDNFGVASKHIISTQDMNLDGIPEVVASISACSGYGCLGIEIFEWNGYEFQSLIRAPIYDSSTGKIIEVSSSAGIDAPTNVEIIDLNDNETLELLITGGYSPWELPTWRYETHVYTWNGFAFVPTHKGFSEPEYLFQAIQDADTAGLDGDYASSTQLYQRGIANREMEWWSTERHKFEQSVIDNKLDKELAPSAQPTQDPTEYPRLAAYAYYRIMLLHLVQRNESEAAATYQILQEKFDDDPYGSAYVEMATAFWEAYQTTHKMYDGCAAAIEYAVEHPEILNPLGSKYHGSQSHIYVPADVCPFR